MQQPGNLRFFPLDLGGSRSGGSTTTAKQASSNIKGGVGQVLSFRPLSSLLDLEGLGEGSDDGSEPIIGGSASSGSVEALSSDEEGGDEQPEEGCVYAIEWRVCESSRLTAAAECISHHIDLHTASSTDDKKISASSSLAAACTLVACLQQAQGILGAAPTQELLGNIMSCALPSSATSLSAPGTSTLTSSAASAAALGAARCIARELQLSDEPYMHKVFAGCTLMPQLAKQLLAPIKDGDQLAPHNILKKGPLFPYPGLVAISGGLGSLGLLIAQWLAQLGVQHILLLARSARTTSAASQHLCQLWQGQAQAMVSACDAGCAEDVSATLAPSAHHQHLPPLCSVLHAGGVLADATLRNQTLSGLRKVMGAKVSGLPHLLGAAQLQPGAHHVLFSSVASLLGSPGQANYSAANAALDAAASSWQHTGLPTVSVQWGAWAGGGMAANDAGTCRYPCLLLCNASLNWTNFARVASFLTAS